MSGADDQPLLVLSREDKGRVALLLSDQAWLWARGFHDGGPHLDLLRRLAHWLMKEPDLEEALARDRARQPRHDRAPDPDRYGRAGRAHLALGRPHDRDSGRGEPGLWQATVDAESPACTASRTASSSPSSASARRTRANTRRCFERFEPLALAEATGGSVRRVATKPDDTSACHASSRSAGVSLFRRRLYRHSHHRLVGGPWRGRDAHLPRLHRPRPARGEPAGGMARRSSPRPRQPLRLGSRSWSSSRQVDPVGGNRDDAETGTRSGRPDAIRSYAPIPARSGGLGQH